MLSLSPPRCIPDRRDRSAQNVRLNELKRTFVSRPSRQGCNGGPDQAPRPIDRRRTRSQEARSRAKVEIALARGKDLYDKRDTIRKRDMARDVQRELRDAGR